MKKKHHNQSEDTNATMRRALQMQLHGMELEINSQMFQLNTKISVLAAELDNVLEVDNETLLSFYNRLLTLAQFTHGICKTHAKAKKIANRLAL